MILTLHDLQRQGLSISEIARRTGLDRKTVRKYLQRGLAPPAYGPRRLAPYGGYLRERVEACAGLSGRRLYREIRALGYRGGYTAVTDYLRRIRPPFERRFETAPGRQAQMDFAEFLVEFADQPGVRRRVWLFALVLGHSRWLWGRFCPSQKLDTVLRCHVLAFEVCGGATAEVLYDRMKTAVLGEHADGTVRYHPALVALLRHYGAAPRACRAYRAKTKGKVERPFRYIRQDFFLDRTFRNLDDLNARFAAWCAELANARVHGTANRVVQEAFTEERAHLRPLPLRAYDAVLTVERRVSHEGMVSVNGNLYSVPDRTRKRVLEVQHHPLEIRIFEDGELIARPRSSRVGTGAALIPATAARRRPRATGGLRPPIHPRSRPRSPAARWRSTTRWPGASPPGRRCSDRRQRADPRHPGRPAHAALARGPRPGAAAPRAGRALRPRRDRPAAARNTPPARAAGSRWPCTPHAWLRSRPSRASTSRSSRRSTATGSWPWPSSSSSTARKCFICSVRPAPANRTWRPPSA